jgi:hypothetical protein
MRNRFLTLAIAFVAIIALAGAASASLRYFDTDRLNEGQNHTITLKLGKGQSYMIVSASSQGGVDFDLAVLGPDGATIIESDSTDENTDWLRFKPAADGDFKIRIKAFKGSGWYELMVINTGGY